MSLSQPHVDPTLAPRRPRGTARYYWAVFLLFFLGFCALAIDIPVARWAAAGHISGDFAALFELAEVFAHGIGIAGILVTVGILDRSQRWALPRVVCMVLCTGMLCNLIKLMVERYRPRSFDLAQSAQDSFAGFLPLLSGGSDGQSMPSAHAASAAALAVALAWLYPRAAIWWGALAVFASLQRIDSLSHFPSDTLWGVAIGLLIGGGILHGWLSNPWLDRLEYRLYAGGALHPDQGEWRPLSAEIAQASQFASDGAAALTRTAKPAPSRCGGKAA
ncbi:MAG: phosphatase PAP2 family protein [Pirellulales bacterium]